MQIVAIGGGNFTERETLGIDRFIVELTGKRNSPKALFIPTASGDADSYCSIFDCVYGKLLGCRTSALRLLTSMEDRKHAEEKIHESDLVYVGGGNTLRMMKLWRRFGIDRMLQSAGNRGVVLSGMSAGGICWHDFGLSDSNYFSRRSDCSYFRVRGLGLCSGLFCPHFDVEKREVPFSGMIQRYGGVGIACDNNAAIWYDHGRAVAKTTDRTARVHVFRREPRSVREERYHDGQPIELPNKQFSVWP